MRSSRIPICVLALSLLALVATNAIHRLEPRAPSKPIDVMIEVGSVATTGDKATVSVLARVSGNEIQIRAFIKDGSMMGSSMTPMISESAPLRSAIKEVCAEVAAKRDAERQAGSFTVTGVTKDGVSLVRVEAKRKPGEIKFEKGSIDFDPDNAETLADRLQRAEEIGEWLVPRLEGLKVVSAAPATPK